MNKFLVLPILLIAFAITASAQPPMKNHQPKTVIHEAFATMMLNQDGFQEVTKMEAKCPAHSNISDIDLGGVELGSHDENKLPPYIKRYHDGLKTKNSRVELWKTIVPRIQALIKYCYYDDPADNFVVIYMEDHEEAKTPKP